MSQRPPRPEDNAASDDVESEAPLEDEDEDGEAFVDLSDPNLEVHEIDDTQAPPPDEEEVAEALPQGEMPTDKVPLRDDAARLWVCGKPLHAAAAHPTNPAVVAVAGEDDAATVLVAEGEGREFKPAATMAGHSDTITQLAFSPDGTLLATGAMDCAVRVWSTADWTCQHVLQDLSGEVELLLWHPSSKVLVGGGSDAQALLWNVAKGSVAQYFVGHRGGITSAVWAMDVKKLITAASDGSVIQFNPKTGEAEVTIAKDLSPDSASVTRLQLLGQETVIAGCEDGTMHVISLPKGKAVAHLDEVHEQAIESICYNAELNLVASCSCDAKVAIWNGNDYSLRSLINVGEGIVRMLWIDALLFAACTDGDVRVWDGRLPLEQPQATLMGHSRLVLDIAMTADGGHLLSTADDGTARLFAAAAWQPQPVEAAPAAAHDAEAAAAADANDGTA